VLDWALSAWYLSLDRHHDDRDLPTRTESDPTDGDLTKER
jgi:hypothetical protein